MFAYCGNNPVINWDPTGATPDAVWDIISFGISFAEVVANPANPVAWFSLAADAACLVIPGLTGGGGIVHFVAGADKLADAAKLTDRVVDGTKAIKSSTDFGKKMHDTYMVMNQADDLFTNRTLGKVFEEVTSSLRPDAIDTANKILYELKPYNSKSFAKAINQVDKYFSQIPGNRSDWTVVIDMYY